MNSTHANLIQALDAVRVEPVCDWVQKFCPVIGSKHGVPLYKVDDYAEYVRQPLEDCMPDSPVTNINFVAGIGAGKSELISALTQRNIKLGRTTLLANYTENMLRKFLDSRLMPAIKLNRDISHLIPEKGRARVLKDRIVLDNLTLFTESMTLSQLQAVSVDCVIMDEIWLAKEEAGGLIRYAKGRGHDRAAFKFINVSQASLAHSPWHHHVTQASEFHFGTTCDGCGESFLYDWDFIKWDDVQIEAGGRDLDACADTARLECPHCNHQHKDEHNTRSRLSSRGSYTQISWGRKRERTYYAPALCFRGTTWASVVLQFLEANQEYKATDRAELLEIFETQRLVRFHVPPNRNVAIGEDPSNPYTLDDVSPDNWEKFLEDKEDFAMNIMGIDCQKGHYYVSIRAHFRDGTRILLHRSKVEDDDEGNGGALIKIADEYKVKNQHVGIDGGYKFKDTAKLVVQFAKREGQDPLAKILGARIPNRPIITRGHTGKTDQTWLINVTRSKKKPVMRRFPHSDFLASNHGKTTVLELKFQNLYFKDQVRSLMSDADLFQLPVDEEMEDYISHMTLEVRKQIKGGTYKYEKPYNSARVDWFDTEVITALIARINNIPDPLGGGDAPARDES